jgi:hypothetical protein
MSQQRRAVKPTAPWCTPSGSESSTGNESSSLSRAAAAISATVPGTTEREIREVIRHLQADPNIRNTAAYLTAAVANGDSAALIAEARNRLDNFTWFGGTSSNGTRPWCGTCDQQTRQIERDDGRAARCPDCHPLTGSNIIPGEVLRSTTNDRARQVIDAGRHVQEIIDGAQP